MNPSFDISEYMRRIGRLAALIRDVDAKVAAIRAENQGPKLKQKLYEQEHSRVHQARADFEAAFRAELLSLRDDFIRPLRACQPRLADLQPEAMDETAPFPDFWVAGRLRLQKDRFDHKVPLPRPFPPENALCMPAGEAADTAVQGILLRLLTCIPAGKLNIYAADPRSGGAALGALKPLLREKSIFPQMAVLTKENDMAAAVSQLRDTMDGRTQALFTPGCDTWAQYNAAHPEQPLPYTVLVLTDALSQLSSQACWQLARLVERGPSAGILPIITYREEDLQENARKELRTLLPSLAAAPAAPAASAWNPLRVEPCPEELPDPATLNRLVDAILQAAAKKRTSRRMEQLWQGVPLFSECSAEGVCTPIGWDADGKPVDFKLGSGGTLQHALVAGSTGSGKSNLLHVLIHGLCHRYSPAELRLYLMDFKHGVEFNAYAEPKFPHARLVDTAGDAEFGISVLRHLCEEMETRNRLFKQSGVPSYAEFRKRFPQPLPRILLLIDEFQKLFEDEGKFSAQSASAQSHMKDLLRLGRSAGIHVLLSTQSLSGLNTVSINELVGQLGCRLVLQCTEADCARLLAPGNSAAAHITSPPEGVLNTAGGEASCNVVLTIPMADAETCPRHLEAIRSAIPAADMCETVVFRGVTRPERPAWGEGDCVPAPDGREGALTVPLGITLEFSGGVFSLPFGGEEASPHLAILGPSTEGNIGQSLLQSVVDALANRGGRRVTCFYFGRQPDFRDVDVEFKKMPGDLAELPVLLEKIRGGEKRALVFVRPELCRDLQDPLPTIRISRGGEEAPSPRAVLETLLGAENTWGCPVVCLCEKAGQLGGGYKKLFGMFERRIMFKLPEIQAKMLCGDIQAPLRDICKDDRAAYINSQSGELQWFRPYLP